MKNTISILNIVGRVLTFVIIGLAIFFTIYLMVQWDPAWSNDIPKGVEELGSSMGLFFNFTYVIIALIGLVIVSFGIIQFIDKPKSAIRMLIALGILGLIALIAYQIASPDIDEKFVAEIADDVTVTDSLSRGIGAGLIGTFILAGLAVLTIVYSWISKIIKG